MHVVKSSLTAHVSDHEDRAICHTSEIINRKQDYLANNSLQTGLRSKYFIVNRTTLQKIRCKQDYIEINHRKHDFHTNNYINRITLQIIHIRLTCKSFIFNRNTLQIIHLDWLPFKSYIVNRIILQNIHCYLENRTSFCFLSNTSFISYIHKWM